MPSVAESLTTQTSQMSATLQAGLDVLSASDTVTFHKYVRVVLPVDGFVFWVRDSILTPGARFGLGLLNSYKFSYGPQTAPATGFNGNSASYAPLSTVVPPTPHNLGFNGVPTSSPNPITDLVVKGSLHYRTQANQSEDESYSVNQVVFTTSESVDNFETMDPGTIYIGTYDSIRFAFSEHGNFYRQADLWHYSGTAIVPTMESQIIDNPLQFDSINPVVSNSLPIWLSIQAFTPPAPIWRGPVIPMFPSFLIPRNQPLPYIAINIPPESIEALQAIASMDANGSLRQLVSEDVEFTVFGLRNDAIWDFAESLVSLSMLGGYGIMEAPVIVDAKSTQPELDALAMKKTIRIKINYNQGRLRNLVRQLIEKVVLTSTVGTINAKTTAT